MKQKDLDEQLQVTRLMEKGQLQEQMDMHKKLQMESEFKKLQDEEDFQENEALKAQADLEIA